MKDESMRRKCAKTIKTPNNCNETSAKMAYENLKMTLRSYCTGAVDL
jgi:hypothetical protein